MAQAAAGVLLDPAAPTGTLLDALLTPDSNLIEQVADAPSFSLSLSALTDCRHVLPRACFE